MEKPCHINKTHRLDEFDCSSQELNDYLKNHALQSQNSHAARTYVVVENSENNKVIAYYSLAYSSVGYEKAPDRVRKGLSRNPVPTILLARLAVDNHFKGQRIGPGLLKDAMRKAVQASDIAGLRAVWVHSKDQKAKGFYETHGFTASPNEDLHLFFMMKDLKALLTN